MFRIIIRNEAGSITNFCEKPTIEECYKWEDDNKEFFPKNFTSKIDNTKEEKDFQIEVDRGEHYQSIGRRVLAMIHAINTKRLKSGEIHYVQLSTMLDNDEVKKIERFLINGYLNGAVELIKNISLSIFEQKHKDLIISYIENNK